MDNENLSQGPCPIGRGLARIGDTWSMLILRDASQGLTRFDQFRKSLCIAPTILTRRLAALTEDGLLEKRRYSDHPPRDEYVLTQAGRDFLPVLTMMSAWVRKHYAGGGAMTRLIDAERGTDVQPFLLDKVTGAEIGTRKLKLVPPAR
jgi:DNA-binding HxlR family transcriptional regulator